MKLTKKARIFLKEADKVAPLLSKECLICKHHNPNHLILISEEAGFKILCKKCNAPETEIANSATNSVVEELIAVQEQVTPNETPGEIELKPGMGKTKIEKATKTRKSTKPKKEKIIKPKKTKKGKEWPDKHAYMETKEWNESWEKEETLYPTDNSTSSHTAVTQWNLAYGPVPKGFRGKVWLAESPDPVPVRVYTDEKGSVHEIYHIKLGT